MSKVKIQNLGLKLGGWGIIVIHSSEEEEEVWMEEDQ